MQAEFTNRLSWPEEIVGTRSRESNWDVDLICPQYPLGLAVWLPRIRVPGVSKQP